MLLRYISCVNSFIPSLVMNKFLFFLIAAVYLLSPFGPTWGPRAVGLGVILVVFNYGMKTLPKRRYEDYED